MRNNILASDVSVFSSASGGLSSSLAGGNFWQGAAIGLTVSALNHVAHRIEEIIEEATIQKYVRQAGYDPHGTPKQTVEYANTMMERVALLKANKTLSGGRARIKGIMNDPDVHGRTISEKGDIYLSTGTGFTFASNTTLALVIYHESLHVVYYWNANFSNQLKNYTGNGTVGEYEHYLIFQKMYRTLLDSNKYYYDMVHREYSNYANKLGLQAN